jgi:hypothetical protein
MKRKRSLIVAFILGLVIGGVSGGAYQVGRASAASNGFIGASITGYALQFDGNASQSLNTGGLVKAMLYVDPTRPVGQQIVRCYNSQTSGSAVSTPPCGFTLTNPAAGNWYINFGFDVSQRFAVASSRYSNYGISLGYSSDTGLNNNTLAVGVYETDAYPPVYQNDGKYTLVVY